ncbi:hypothetical protein [Pseudonocardia sp. TRM90224]|uniref:hypothetical protein n=1 Tax=Pseudonocardia sp. TRM90224 TaxID=2812678 RepID=UPI001E453593|nr:hypothetical protein [Pseudonocardia sp. TRM90224]
MSERSRIWQIEPYGDELTLSPQDSLVVEIEDGPEALIEIDLRPGELGERLWVSLAGDVEAPTDLKLNGRSVWPSG